MSERERSEPDVEPATAAPESPTAGAPLQSAFSSPGGTVARRPARPADPHSLLALQRSAGNTAVTRLLRETGGPAAPAPAAPAAAAGPARTLITDGDPAATPGAISVRDFLDRLQDGLGAIPELAAGAAMTGGIHAWLQGVAGGGAQALVAALAQLAPETRSATSAEELVSAVVAQAQRIATGAAGPLEPRLAALLGDRAPVLTKRSEGVQPSRDATPGVVERLGSGEPLPSEVRSPMEQAFGESFSGVRLHRDGAAAQVSSQLAARAFAVGPHVGFAAGQYKPGTPIGDALIAHELAHVSQQRESGPALDRKAEAGPPAAALEEDADRSAVEAVASLHGLAPPGRRLSGSKLSRLQTSLRLSLDLCGSPAPPAATGVTPAPPTPAPAPAPPAPYAWRNTTLKGMVDGTDTPAAILVYIGSLNAADRTTAQEDLQLGRRDYSDRAVQPDAVEKMNRVLRRLYRDIATAQAPGVTAPTGGWPAGGAPAALTAGTHTPTTAERDRLRDALVPPGQAPGAMPDFHSRIAGQPDPYETRITTAIDTWVTNMTAQLVTGRGTAEHATPARLNSWARYEQVANVAKQQVDRVFGSYSRGPAFRHGTALHPGNLMDRFEDEEATRATQTPTQKRTQAEEFVRYIIQSDDSIRTINHEHGAVVGRDTLSPGETEHEKAILDRVVLAQGARHEAALLDIDRGWEGVAVPGMVWLQRWRRPTAGGQREHFWDTLQIMMHEYIHTLEHPLYRAYAASFPGGTDSLQYNTLIEGMCSAFTETAWANVNLADRGLARRVEGSSFGTPAETAAAIPDVSNRRYGSFSEAMAAISVVGPRNAYAAYFLGQTDLIRASP